MARSTAPAKRASFGLALFELLPQCDEFFAERRGQHAQDPLDADQFCGLAFLPAAFDEDHCVSSVDFADVVDQDHADDAIQVDRGVGVRLERGREHRKLPAMLSRIFVAVEAQRLDLAGYAFELVQLQDEVDYLLHAFLSTPVWLSFRRYSRYPSQCLIRKILLTKGLDFKLFIPNKLFHKISRINDLASILVAESRARHKAALL